MGPSLSSDEKRKDVSDLSVENHLENCTYQYSHNNFKEMQNANVTKSVRATSPFNMKQYPEHRRFYSI